MNQIETGSGWRVKTEGNVMIWEFLSGMELSAFEDEAYPVFEELLSTGEFDGLVTDVRLDEPFTAETFAVWEESAQRASEADIARWAVVATGIKAISLTGKLDTGGMETLKTEQRSDAIEWAQG